ncbi:MAG: glycosyltransferase [Chloroflexia bacterium]|nr:glycosyltransferase [Chloroflexia bacterium]
MLFRNIQKKSSRIKLLVNKKNKGYGYSLNKGFANANGDILCRLDPDDKLKENALELMVNAHFLDEGLALVYSTHYKCDEKLNIVSVSDYVGPIPNSETYLTFKNNYHNNISQFATFKKKFYLKTSGVNPKFKRAVDKDLYYKLEEVGKTLFIPEAFYYYRHHPGSISLFKNELKARLWEMKAKENAYKRRLDTDIKNITLTNVRENYIFIYKKLVFSALKNRHYYAYVKYLLLLGKYLKAKHFIRFCYYSMKKTIFPKAFVTND